MNFYEGYNEAEGENYTWTFETEDTGSYTTRITSSLLLGLLFPIFALIVLASIIIKMFKSVDDDTTGGSGDVY